MTLILYSNTSSSLYLQCPEFLCCSLHKLNNPSTLKKPMNRVVLLNAAHHFDSFLLIAAGSYLVKSPKGKPWRAATLRAALVRKWKPCKQTGLWRGTREVSPFCNKAEWSGSCVFFVFSFLEREKGISFIKPVTQSQGGSLPRRAALSDSVWLLSLNFRDMASWLVRWKTRIISLQ